MELNLSKGYVAIVDNNDGKQPWRFKWTADVRKYTVYAYRIISGTKKKQYLHQFGEYARTVV